MFAAHRSFATIPTTRQLPDRTPTVRHGHALAVQPATVSAGVRSALMRALSAYPALARKRPLAVAFVTCAFKSGCADMIAQSMEARLEHRPTTIDYRRTAAFSLFGGAYTGCAQLVIYNRVFAWLFGEGRSVRAVASKVLADNLILMPFVAMPLNFIACATLAQGGSVSDGLAAMRREGPSALIGLWQIWLPGHLVSFAVMPPDLRILWCATLSLGSLTFMSHKANKEAPPPLAAASAPADRHHGAAFVGAVAAAAAAPPAAAAAPRACALSHWETETANLTIRAAAVPLTSAEDSMLATGMQRHGCAMSRWETDTADRTTNRAAVTTPTSTAHTSTQHGIQRRRAW